VLLTSCADGICRLWSETLLPEDSLLGGQISENSTSISSTLPNVAQKDKIQHALEVSMQKCTCSNNTYTCRCIIHSWHVSWFTC